MNVRTQCEHCGYPYVVDESGLNTRAVCKRCLRSFIIVEVLDAAPGDDEVLELEPLEPRVVKPIPASATAPLRTARAARQLSTVADLLPRLPMRVVGLLGILLFVAAGYGVLRLHRWMSREAYQSVAAEQAAEAVRRAQEGDADSTRGLVTRIAQDYVDVREAAREHRTTRTPPEARVERGASPRRPGAPATAPSCVAMPPPTSPRPRDAVGDAVRSGPENLPVVTPSPRAAAKPSDAPGGEPLRSENAELLLRDDGPAIRYTPSTAPPADPNLILLVAACRRDALALSDARTDDGLVASVQLILSAGGRAQWHGGNLDSFLKGMVSLDLRLARECITSKGMYEMQFLLREATPPTTAETWSAAGPIVKFQAVLARITTEPLGFQYVAPVGYVEARTAELIEACRAVAKQTEALPRSHHPASKLAAPPSPPMAGRPGARPKESLGPSTAKLPELRTPIEKAPTAPAGGEPPANVTKPPASGDDVGDANAHEVDAPPLTGNGVSPLTLERDGNMLVVAYAPRVPPGVQLAPGQALGVVVLLTPAAGPMLTDQLAQMPGERKLVLIRKSKTYFSELADARGNRIGYRFEVIERDPDKLLAMPFVPILLEGLTPKSIDWEWLGDEARVTAALVEYVDEPSSLLPLPSRLLAPISSTSRDEPRASRSAPESQPAPRPCVPSTGPSSEQRWTGEAEVRLVPGSGLLGFWDSSGRAAVRRTGPTDAQKTGAISVNVESKHVAVEVGPAHALMLRMEERDRALGGTEADVIIKEEHGGTDWLGMFVTCTRITGGPITTRVPSVHLTDIRGKALARAFFSVEWDSGNYVLGARLESVDMSATALASADERVPRGRASDAGQGTALALRLVIKCDELGDEFAKTGQGTILIKGLYNLPPFKVTVRRPW